MPAGNATACLVLGSECNPTAVGRLLRCRPLLAETATNVFRGLRRSIVDPDLPFALSKSGHSCSSHVGATETLRCAPRAIWLRTRMRITPDGFEGRGVTSVSAL